MIPWKASSASQLYETVIKVWKLHALAKLVGGANILYTYEKQNYFYPVRSDLHKESFSFEANFDNFWPAKKTD